MAYTNWKEQGNPFLDFTEEITYEWMRNGFDRERCEEWLDIGMKATDAGFCAWLRDEVELEPLEVLNNMNVEDNYQEVDLREQFEEYLEDSKLNEELIEKIIKNFENWTSGNQEIDEFIQKSQLEAKHSYQVLEWIPYSEFEDIEYLDEGGFSRIYTAKWRFGKKWWTKNFLLRKVLWKKVVLKILNNSQNTTSFLREVSNHSLFSDKRRIVPCYGISQDPETKDYIMIMKYMEVGSLRKHLKKGFVNTFNDNSFYELIKWGIKWTRVKTYHWILSFYISRQITLTELSKETQKKINESSFFLTQKLTLIWELYKGIQKMSRDL